MSLPVMVSGPRRAASAMALVARASSLLSQCTHRESWAQGRCGCEMVSWMCAVVLSTHAGLTRGAVHGPSDVSERDQCAGATDPIWTSFLPVYIPHRHTVSLTPLHSPKVERRGVLSSPWGAEASCPRAAPGSVTSLHDGRKAVRGFLGEIASRKNLKKGIVNLLRKSPVNG